MVDTIHDLSSSVPISLQSRSETNEEGAVPEAYISKLG
jgi:hypothetical protein